MIISFLIVFRIVKSGNFKIKTARTLARKKEKVYLCRCSGALFASRPTGGKGNGVRVPDRPAAVNSFIRFMTCCIHCFVGRNGKDMKRE